MTAGTDALKRAFRDYVVNNVPGSGENDPDKFEIRSGFDLISSEFATAMNGMTPYATIAARDAATGVTEGQLGYVYNNNGAAGDPLNGVYQYVSGSWGEAEWYWDVLTTLVQPLVDQAAGYAAATASTAAILPRLDAIGDQMAGVVNYIGAGTNEPIHMNGQQMTLGIRGDSGGLAGTAWDVAMGHITKPLTPLPTADLITLAQWNGLIAYGQSLALGELGRNAVSLVQQYFNLTFTGGVKTGKTGNAISAPVFGSGMAASKALVEDNNNGAGVSTAGESICSGAANWASARAIIDNNIPPASYIIFASTAGHGSYTIAQLNSASTWFQQLKDHIKGAYDLAVAAGKTYKLHAVFWMQGEGDAVGGTAVRATYKNALIQLQADITAAYLTLTGQTNKVHILTYQTPSYILDDPDVVLAQYDAINASPYIHLVSPLYHMAAQFSDGVHLKNLGYLWFSRYCGRAYKQLTIDNCVPECLWPISAVSRGRTITQTYRTRTPLIIDTETMPKATNDYGFKLIDDSGTVPIASITANNDKVTILAGRDLVCADPVNAPVMLRYGIDYIGTGLSITDGKCGNLRDTSLDQFHYGATYFPLFNAAPHHDMPVTKLEDA